MHNQLMEQRDRRAAQEEEEQLQQQKRQEVEEVPPGERSPEEQEATARALKPHSRSLVDLRDLRYQPPEPSAAARAPPRRSRKWQFGIRSRNQPYEAILYLYKAIEAQGGVWDIIPAEPEGGQPPPQQQQQQEAETGSEDEEKPLQKKYPHLPSDFFIPKDPWFIRLRLLKEGVKAPDMTTSSHYSRGDPEELRRRSNAATEGAAGDTSVQENNSTTSQSVSHGVWVFIDIQLYQLEENNYMVDFKCDGYQNVNRSPDDGEWYPVSKRFKNKEKDVNSPFPFLNVASDLVAQLAVAG